MKLLHAAMSVLAVSAAGIAPALAADGDTEKGSENAGATIAAALPAGGDPGGVRKQLSQRGLDYGFNYIGQLQSGVAGGLARRTTYLGRLEGFVDLDFAKIAGRKGLSVHASAFQSHGDGLTATATGSLMPASFIEALPTTRLFEAWAEQSFDDGSFSVRFGQIAADAEFFTSAYGGQFLNGTFGWPAHLAANLPSGGAAFPLATPGVRVQANPTPSLSLLAGVYGGDPAGGCAADTDPQVCNRHGTIWRLSDLSDPPFAIAELQYRHGGKAGAAGLPGAVKIGAWHHFGHFDDRRFDSGGFSLADTTNSTGVPLRHSGLGGVYGIVEQRVWSPVGGAPEAGIGVFGRVSASPGDDRADLGVYVDGGIIFAGLVPGRPDDIIGIGAAYTRFTRGAREADRDANAFGAERPVRDHEALVEFNYQAQVMSGWTIDADVQHILHPGGNVAHPDRNDGGAVKDATVLTLHSSLRY